MRLRHALRPRVQLHCNFELVARTATHRATGAAWGSCPQATTGVRCYYHRKVEEGLIT